MTNAASSCRRRSSAPMFWRYSRRIASSTRTCSPLRCSDAICGLEIADCCYHFSGDRMRTYDIQILSLTG